MNIQGEPSANFSLKESQRNNTVHSINSIPDRLDRLPFSGFHKYLLLVCGAGTLVDGIDIGLTGSIMASLGGEWNLQPNQLGLIGSAGFVGMFLGALFSGPLADRFGRRKVFLTTILFIVLFTFMNGLAWNLESFLLFRLLTGIGLGAEVPLMISYFSEMVPSKSRGKLITIFEGFFPIGLILAAILGFILVPRFGWSSLFFVAAAPGIFIFLARLKLFESPRWLLSKNRIQEADHITTAIENTIITEQKILSEVTTEQKLIEGVKKAPIMEIWTKQYAGKTLMLSVVWFSCFYGTYGFLIWLPTLWVQQGLSLSQSLFFTMLLTTASIPGIYCVVPLIDKVGRKKLLIASYLIGIVGILGFGLIGNFTSQIIFGFIFNFATSMSMVCLYAYTPELFPTRMRATAVSFASSAGRVGGIVAPIVAGLVITSLGNNSAIFLIVAGLFLLSVITIFLFARETMGTKLEN
ncbi:putative MFS transporter [Neobacillus niacini]|uniref:MFS transporter n=1 Tax=Neobacillus niacini TaxID=86668 RepID=UPI00285C6FFC|nr:MFS transporter [Neobacillus niacini]MDR7080221.1 putative MFS transporter [Neobacillus niacini]